MATVGLPVAKFGTMTTRHAGIALLSALAVAGVEAETRACSLAPPGIYSRDIWPGQDAHPPVNTRVIVRYGLGPTGFGTQPAPIGPDLVLLDGDGSVVPTTQEIAGGDVILRPDAPLLPNHGYQVADRRTVPCNNAIALQDTCTLTDAPVAFSSFTTGTAADGTAPTFAGIASSSVGAHEVCDNDACCGPYDVHHVDLLWAAAADDVAGADVRYTVYHRDGATLTPVATWVAGTKLAGAAWCSGAWGSPSLSRGSYIVRAVDYAGNEDTNSVALELGDPCRDTPGCAVGGPEPRTSSGPAAIAAAGILLLAGLLGLRARRRAG